MHELRWHISSRRARASATAAVRPGTRREPDAAPRRADLALRPARRTHRPRWGWVLAWGTLACLIGATAYHGHAPLTGEPHWVERAPHPAQAPGAAVDLCPACQGLAAGVLPSAGRVHWTGGRPRTASLFSPPPDGLAAVDRLPGGCRAPPHALSPVAT